MSQPAELWVIEWLSDDGKWWTDSSLVFNSPMAAELYLERANKKLQYRISRYIRVEESSALNGGSEAAVAEKVCDDYYGGKYQQEEDTPRESLKRIIVEALASAPPVDVVSYDKCYTTTGCILPNDHKGNCDFGLQAEVTELKRLLERTVIGYHARYCNGKFDDCHDPTCGAARKAIE